MHVLRAAALPGADAALRRARRYLATMEGRDGEPALWHDKDLYRPAVIVRAAVAAARHLLRAATAGGAPDRARERTTAAISAA